VDPDIGIPRSCPPAAALGLPPRGELWVLRELLHYLSGEASGAVGFEDMGENWVGVRKAARDGTLRAGDAAVRDVAERWEQFTNYLSLSLSQELGAKVTVARPRSQTTTERLDELVRSLAESGELFAVLRIPDAVGAVEIRTNLKTRQTSTAVAIDAPREGRVKARFNWLLRQLREASDELRIEAAFPNARATTVATLGDLRGDPAGLYYPPDPKREPRAFVVTQTKAMGQKRGRAEGSFVSETAAQAVEFYRDIVQNLKGWQAPAPKLRVDTETTPPEIANGPIAPAWSTDQPPGTGSDSPANDDAT
jgi:hypothetical protein